MRVAELKALAREHRLRGYSRLRKAELIALLQNNPPLPPAPCPRPPRGPAGEAPPSSPRRPTRGPQSPDLQRAPPPPPPLVRFRPDRPRQPELMRQLEERNPQPPKHSTPLALPVAGCSGPRTSAPTLKPYQLKPKRGKETFIEPPSEQKELPTSGAKALGPERPTTAGWGYASRDLKELK